MQSGLCHLRIGQVDAARRLSNADAHAWGDGRMTLLTMRVYVFTCDTRGCEEATGDIVPPNLADSARSAWRVARQDGWTVADANRHCCPVHGRAGLSGGVRS